MKKRILGIVSLLMVALLLASCGADVMNESMNGAFNKGGYTYDSETSIKENGSSADAAPDEAAALERKIIKTYHIRVETLEYDKAVDMITSSVEEFGGYIANASQEGTGVSSTRTRSASYTIRIPAERADAYIERLSGECNVLSSSLTTEDVTDTYYGYEAKMESLTTQEERLLSMLEKAETLNELIILEDKLASVRAEINGLSKQLQLMDKSVRYSYVYVTLNEVREYQEPEKETYLDRLGDSIGGTFKSFATVLGEILLITIWLLPYTLVAVAVVVVILVLKKRRKKDPKNGPKNDQDKT